MSQKYLTRRGNQWQFYRRVPTDLVDEIGLRFWRVSLQTDSRRLAEQRVIGHVHRTNLLIAEARSGVLTDETIQQTAHTWHWSTHFSGGHNGLESREMIAASVREHVESRLKVKRPTDWERLIDQCVQELEKGKLGSGAVPIGTGTEELNADY